VRLTGRRAECGVLVLLVDAVRAGESRALVLHGEPGVGTSALLEYLAGHASGCRVARAAGVQSEMELAFAGLHQLCAPLLDRLSALPPPQRDALSTAFGMSTGPAPDRFLIGLAVLSLLSHAAEEQPLVCLVEDEQWLDRASAQVLAFVARRLGAESVGLVFAAREPTGDLAGLPELVVRGLSEGDARALLDSVLRGPLDGRVRDQVVAETRGNPLALVELPRGLTVAELAGGFGLPGAAPLAGSIEESFRRRVGVLPSATQRLLLVAAADPTGDPALVWRAAERLGIGADAAAPAADAERPQRLGQPAPEQREQPEREGRVGGHRRAPAARRVAPRRRGQVDHDRDGHAGRPGDQRQHDPAPVAQLADVEGVPGLQADREEEDGHQPAVDPVAQRQRHRRPARTDHEPRRPEHLVRGRPQVGPDQGHQRRADQRDRARDVAPGEAPDPEPQVSSSVPRRGGGRLEHRGGTAGRIGARRRVGHEATVGGEGHLQLLIGPAGRSRAAT
jgi:hypothetical protein